MTKAEKDLKSPIGAVFTPLKNTENIIRFTGLYKKWLNGATILDPTAGTGNFLEAFIKTAFDEQQKITESMVSSLYAVEMQQEFINHFHKKIKREYNITFPEKNFICGDYLFTDTGIKADYLIGNPPWLNFCDLENNYKSKIKHLFLETELAPNKKDLLLGSSRIDIAALIITESIRKNLLPNGKAYFFLPLSLFLNEGAHKGFRLILKSSGNFSVDDIWDYKNHPIFPEVSTRYGFASFTNMKKNTYPIDYFESDQSGNWTKKQASPYGQEGGPYIIHEINKKPELPVIHIRNENRPRQGLNTCGANKLFIFDHMEIISDKLCIVSGKNGESILPRELVYPLISAAQFKEDDKNRFVFVPYNQKGKVLSEKQMKQYPEAYSYLLKYEKFLKNRKGVLIRSSINKGLWWSLLGLGKYSFAPWKVVWQAFGKKEFSAKLFSSSNGKLWQPNQALQAFLPFYNKKEAEKALKELQNPQIEQILKNHGMEGTCNWAQPGRMMKFFKFTDEI